MGRWRRGLVRRADILLVIAAGGAVGSLARWQLSMWLPPAAAHFPWATFTANVLGCFLLGSLMVFVSQVWPPSRYVRPFLGIGVLGGFTTFSTFMLDARGLLADDHPTLALTYVVGSVTAGLASVWLGAAATHGLLRTTTGARRRNPR